MVRNIILATLGFALIIFGCQKKSVEPQGVKEWQVTGIVSRSLFGTPVRDLFVILGGDSCRTDSTGRYLFKNVPEGKYQIAVRTIEFKWYKDSLTVSQNAFYDIFLKENANLVGQVRNRGGGYVPGAMISIGEKQDTADASGVYALSSVPMGLNHLTCTHDGFYPLQDTVTAFAVQHRRDIILESEYNLVGKVTSRVGFPIDSAVIIVDGFTAITDDSGYYQMPLIPVGEAIITCIKYDYQLFQDTIAITSRQQMFNIILDSKYNLVGFVVSPDVSRLKGAIVSIGEMSDTTDDSGYYQLQSVPIGSYLITCVKPEYYPFQSTVSVTSTPRVFNIYMCDKYNLKGYVGHWREGALEGAIVSVGSISDTTDAGGYYQLALVPRGRQVLKCKKFNYFNIVDTLDITGAQQEKNMVLRKIIADTAYVTEDAMIRYYSDYDSCEQTNYGQEVYLGTYSNKWLTKEYYWIDGRYDEMYVWHQLCEDALFKLPPLAYSNDTAEYIGAFLVLNFAVTYYGTCPSIMKVSEPLSDWSADEITFDNRPEFSNPYNVPNFTPEEEFQIDVSAFYKTHDAFTYGIVLNTPSSEAYLCTDGQFFIISSECSDQRLAPKVIIKYAW